jgi:hypothetical protein
MLDDCDRFGELETMQEIFQILQKNGIKYNSRIYTGSKDHLLVCSKDLEFLTTL